MYIKYEKKPCPASAQYTFSEPIIRKPKQAGAPSSEWQLKLALTEIPASLSTKKICEREKLGNDLAHLLMDEETSDLVLVVEGFHFYVHKLILGARSSYFRAMFRSGMKESADKEITLTDVSLASFKRILVYIYTAEITFASDDLESIKALVGLANQYELTSLLSELSNHMT
uniref:BTB domain-containing protein n=1 Tax=Ditylenchus dipsaci TaxID=166011 RepID=A0A915E481_9BILA